jgi:hypothetical protein
MLLSSDTFFQKFPICYGMVRCVCYNDFAEVIPHRITITVAVVLSISREEAISSLSSRKEVSFMSVDSVISLIALFVAIITLVIRSVSLGMQIEKDTNETKKDRQSDK